MGLLTATYLLVICAWRQGYEKTKHIQIRGALRRPVPKESRAITPRLSSEECGPAAAVRVRHELGI